MKKITKLTRQQEAQFSRYRQEWTNIGLCTDPADRDAAERGMQMAYAAANLPSPKIVWCDSPMSGAITRGIALGLVEDRPPLDKAGVLESVRASVEGNVGAKVAASVWASVGASVRAGVWESVGDSVRAGVEAGVWARVQGSVVPIVGSSVVASVRDSVATIVRSSVWDTVVESVRASVWESVRASMGDAGYGSHDADWIAFYQFFRHECGLEEETNPLEGLTMVAKNCGWYWAHEGICWMTDRPKALHQNERKQLHNLTGPAIEYRDGWKIYAVRGVRVPEYVIERPQEITVEKIEGEKNAEVRRVMIDQYAGGQEKYIKDCGAEIIHTDEFGTLYRKWQENDEPIVMVNVICPSTGREYMLGVDPSCYAGEAGNNARAAVASTWRRENGDLIFASPNDYAPTVQT